MTGLVVLRQRGRFGGVATTEPPDPPPPPVGDLRSEHLGWALGAAIEPGAMPLTPAGNALLNTYMDQVALSGSRWVRVACSWQRVQQGTTPNPPYDWTQPDRIVAAAQTRNLKVILTISHCPRWAALNTANTTTSWRAPSTATLAVGGAFSVWCAAVAARYGVGGTHYPGTVVWFEIWNEPNLQGFWQDELPNASKYVTMLQRGYDAIKAVNPANQVMSGGLAPVPNAQSFGNAIIPPGRFDAFCHHAYPPMQSTYPSQLSAMFGPFSSFTLSSIASVEGFRAVMVTNGWGSKQIHSTESGYHTATGNKTNFSGVPQATQAAGMRMIVEWWEAQSYTGLLTFHTFANPGTVTTDIEQMYGQYCTHTYVPKAGAAEWQALVAEEWGSGL